MPASTARLIVSVRKSPFSAEIAMPSTRCVMNDSRISFCFSWSALAGAPDDLDVAELRRLPLGADLRVVEHRDVERLRESPRSAASAPPARSAPSPPPTPAAPATRGERRHTERNTSTEPLHDHPSLRPEHPAPWHRSLCLLQQHLIHHDDHDDDEPDDQPIVERRARESAAARCAARRRSACRARRPSPSRGRPTRLAPPTTADAMISSS